MTQVMNAAQIMGEDYVRRDNGLGGMTEKDVQEWKEEVLVATSLSHFDMERVLPDI